MRSPAKSDAIAANYMPFILRPTGGGGREQPASGVCGEPESKTAHADRLYFTVFGGPWANHRKASPLRQEKEAICVQKYQFTALRAGAST